MRVGIILDGRYEILKEIGRGGMSVVYLAMDNRLNKSLAVKEIRKRREGDHEWLLNSLIIEANMLKKLDHGSLPKIYDIIEQNGDIFVVMDYVEGESLKQKLERETKASVEEIIDWAQQLGDVLGYLHSRKPNPIIYRDMKPDNIMLTPEGKIKLIDFGIAREYKVENHTDTTNLGTKCYAAPEQMAGKQTDERTDMYSLGVTLYHLLTGKTINEPPYKIVSIRQWDNSFPEGLEYMLEKCTQSRPEDRYQTCEEFLYDLQNIHKLTEGYKVELRKKFYQFLVPATLSLLSFCIAGYGYLGMKEEKYLNYKGLVNLSSQALLKGDEAKAVEHLETAITKVDHQRGEAYMNLLDIYIRNGRADEGLKKIESYMYEEHGKIHENPHVLFKVGMTYFTVQKDYQSAFQYFDQVDVELVPAATYYRSLAQTMGMMNVDYTAFQKELQEFENYNNETRDNEQKVANYNTLAGIYLSYKGQLPDANSESIRLVEKAKELLRRLEDEQLTLRYEVDLEQKLAQAHYSRGIQQEDFLEAKQDFERSHTHYENLLTLDVRNEEEVRLKIGQIYYEMGEVVKSVGWFEKTLEKFPQSISTHVKLGNLLLDIELEKEEDTRNYAQLVNLYQQCGRLEGAYSDEGFKKFTRRLQNVSAI